MAVPEAVLAEVSNSAREGNAGFEREQGADPLVPPDGLRILRARIPLRGSRGGGWGRLFPDRWDGGDHGGVIGPGIWAVMLASLKLLAPVPRRRPDAG